MHHLAIRWLSAKKRATIPYGLGHAVRWVCCKSPPPQNNSPQFKELQDLWIQLLGPNGQTWSLTMTYYGMTMVTMALGVPGTRVSFETVSTKNGGTQKTDRQTACHVSKATWLFIWSGRQRDKSSWDTVSLNWTVHQPSVEPHVNSRQSIGPVGGHQVLSRYYLSFPQESGNSHMAWPLDLIVSLECPKQASQKLSKMPTSEPSQQRFWFHQHGEEMDVGILIEFLVSLTQRQGWVTIPSQWVSDMLVSELLRV